jgi:hypothetical protein
MTARTLLMIYIISMVKQSLLNESGKEYAISTPSTNEKCGEGLAEPLKVV